MHNFLRFIGIVSLLTSTRALASTTPDLSLLAKGIPQNHLEHSSQVLSVLGVSQDELNESWNKCLPLVKKELLIEALKANAPQKHIGTGAEGGYASSLRIDPSSGEPKNFSQLQAKFKINDIYRITPLGPQIDDVTGPRSENLKIGFMVEGEVAPRKNGEPDKVTATVFLDKDQSECYGEYKAVDPKRLIFDDARARSELAKLLEVLKERGFNNSSQSLGKIMKSQLTADELLGKLQTDLKLSPAEALKYLPAVRSSKFWIEKNLAVGASQQPPATSGKAPGASQ